MVGSIRRELKLKHSNTVLGVFWLIIQPLVMISIYALIFSKVMHGRLAGAGGEFAYSIYLCTGIIFWGLFADLTTRLVNVFLSNANLIKKVNFPKTALLVIEIIGSLINFLIVFLIFLIFLIFSGNSPGFKLLYVVPILLAQIIFCTGLGLYLGILNIFFRDVGQFFNISLQIWFWLTPIVYPVEILPSFAKMFVSYNPVGHFISNYQQVIVYGLSPDWKGVAVIFTASIILLFFALQFMQNTAGEIVDEL